MTSPRESTSAVVFLVFHAFHHPLASRQLPLTKTQSPPLLTSLPHVPPRSPECRYLPLLFSLACKLLKRREPGDLQERLSFSGDAEGVTLSDIEERSIDKDARCPFSSFFIILLYCSFDFSKPGFLTYARELPATRYWRLPQRFLGNKVSLVLLLRDSSGHLVWRHNGTGD